MVHDTPNKWAEAVITACYATKQIWLYVKSIIVAILWEKYQSSWVKIRFKAVHASRERAIRAETISALYEQGKVYHFGTLPQLEDQICEWVPGVEKSPDRIDALVLALTKLTERSTQRGNFKISKLIRIVPRNSMDVNSRTSAFYRWDSSISKKKLLDFDFLHRFY
jgi:phage terminase large subunit-like protein